VKMFAPLCGQDSRWRFPRRRRVCRLMLQPAEIPATP